MVPKDSADTKIEGFCNRAAAEFLVPERELRAHWREVRAAAEPFEELARNFKVSPIVVGRRALDLRLVDRDRFLDFYDSYTRRELARTKAPGGSFYNNQNLRVGVGFATMIFRAAKEGRLTFKEAYSLTGLHGGAFQEYARRLGVDLP